MLVKGKKRNPVDLSETKDIQKTEKRTKKKRKEQEEAKTERPPRIR